MSSERLVILAVDHRRRMITEGIKSFSKLKGLIEELSEFFDGILLAPGDLYHLSNSPALENKKIYLSFDGMGIKDTSYEYFDENFYDLKKAYEILRERNIRIEGIKVLLKLSDYRFEDLDPYEEIRRGIKLSWECLGLGIEYMVEVIVYDREKTKVNGFNPYFKFVSILSAKFPYITYFKIPYVENFSKIVSSVSVPLLCLGGPKKDVRTFLESTKRAMEEGAAGVVYGRNVFRDERPRNLMEAIYGIVHKGISIEKALEIYTK